MRAGSHLADDAEEVLVAFVATSVVRALALVTLELVVSQQEPLRQHPQEGPPRSRRKPRGRANCSRYSICTAPLDAPTHEH